MKYLSILAFLAVLICGLNGCASSSDTGTSTAKTGYVPGEAKSAEEDRLAPGASTAGPSATMKW